MSDNGHYILKLKDFESYIKCGWTSLQNDVDFCDVTLVSDESQIKAHKSVLSTCSPVLKHILKKNPHKHPLIYLFGIKFSHLVNLIDFMYQGEVKIPQHEINDLLNLGRDLQVVGLSENEEDVVVDINEEDAKKNCKSPSFKKEGVDINIDNDQKKYRSRSLDIGAKEKNVHIEKDNAKKNYTNDPLETDIVSFKESAEVSNGMNGSKEHSIKHGIFNENFDYKLQDYEAEGLDYNEDLHQNIGDVLNEFPNEDNNTEKVIENINEIIYEKPIFSCDKCQFMATEHDSLIHHTKLVHGQNSVLSLITDTEKKVKDIKKDDAQISYTNYIMKTDIKEKVVGANEDNVKNNCTSPSLENNVLNKEIQKKKRSIKELTGNFEVMKGHKRNKTEPSIKEDLDNKVNDYEQEDFSELSPSYDHQRRNSIKDLQHNILNEFDVYNTSIGNMEEQSNAPLQTSLKCDQCNTKFTQTESLSRHIKSIHEGLRFSCDKCKYTATQDASLKRHIQSVHDKIRYFCEWCDYSATQKSILNKHIKLKH